MGINRPPSAGEQQLSWTTIFKVLAAALFAYLLVRLWPLIELLTVAMLIAMALAPLLRWTRERGWPKWTGVFFCALILFGSALLVFGLVLPTIFSQGGEFIGKLPAFKRELIDRLPQVAALRGLANQLLSAPTFNDPGPLLKQFLAWGTLALAGIAEFFLVLIVAVYFVADGQRVFDWLVAFLPPAHRQRTAGAASEIASVVAHYMVGQLITSVLCGIYALAVLLLFRVPNATLLAVLAAIFDVLPLIGFFLFSIPAVAVAFTVSPAAAAGVATLYLLYKFAEDYYIVPKVYGGVLKLSTLTVLISCLAAGMLAGAIGVIIVLPIVASYPIIERHWLKPFLARDTVSTHETLDKRAHGT